MGLEFHYFETWERREEKKVFHANIPNLKLRRANAQMRTWNYKLHVFERTKCTNANFLKLKYTYLNAQIAQKCELTAKLLRAYLRIIRNPNPHKFDPSFSLITLYFLHDNPAYSFDSDKKAPILQLDLVMNEDKEFHMQSSSLIEERDENGEVVKVGDLEFIDVTLGTGSYASVVLAKRIPTSDTSFDGLIPGSFNTDITIRRKEPSPLPSTEPGPVVSPRKNVKNAEMVAVKIFSKSSLKRMRKMKRNNHNHISIRPGGLVEIHTALEDVEREIALMKTFCHPNVVSLLQVINSIDSDALYVVLEYIPLGEIMTFIPETTRFEHCHRDTPGLTKDGYFQEEHAALFFVDVLHGLGTCM